MTFEEWIEEFAAIQPDGQVANAFKEGAKEAWYFQQDQIDELLHNKDRWMSQSNEYFTKIGELERAIHRLKRLFDRVEGDIKI
jgi:membrane-bound lytic murein transglycosylase MltF